LPQLYSVGDRVLISYLAFILPSFSFITSTFRLRYFPPRRRLNFYRSSRRYITERYLRSHRGESHISHILVLLPYNLWLSGFHIEPHSVEYLFLPTFLRHPSALRIIEWKSRKTIYEIKNVFSKIILCLKGLRDKTSQAY
jgi:hypothetical protein